MRMWSPSASRQPCSAGSCMEVTRNRPSALKRTSRWEPFQASISGLASGVGKPERGAAIMGDREPQALGRKGKPADAGGEIERAVALLGADEGGLADRPGERAIGAKRHMIDPFAGGFGKDFRIAVGAGRHQLAVVAGREEALSVADGFEDRALVRPHPALGIAGEQDFPLAQRKGRGGTEEGGGDHVAARVEDADLGGEGGDFDGHRLSFLQREPT